MYEKLVSLLSAKGAISSSRAINALGALVSALLLVFDTVYNGTLAPATLSIFLGYCGGVYSWSKHIESKKDLDVPNNIT